MVLLASVSAAGGPTSPAGADANEVPGAPLLSRSLTVGSNFECARLGDGSVKCWGSGANGLGYGDKLTRTAAGADLPPVPLGTGRTATALSAGERHVCAVLDNGSVKCWGLNASGQLGLGDTSARGDGPGEMGDSLPAVGLGTGRTATAVATGSATPVSQELGHTCAVLDNGSLKCWGPNASGQLGLGDTSARGDGPGEMGDSLPAVELGAGRTAVAVALGAAHTCALLDDGSVKCWGENDSGQLGLGDEVDRPAPPAVPVDLGTGRTATAIAAGENHSCALLDDGTVKCWGYGEFGQLGQGETVKRGNDPSEMGDLLAPASLGTGRVATAITAGARHTCALLDNAQVKCWGRNNARQLGQGDTVNRGDGLGEMGDNLLPVDLGTGRTALAVTAGGATTCAVLDNAQLKCWGTRYVSDQMGDALASLPLTGSGLAGRVTNAVTGQRVGGVFLAVLSAVDFSMVRGVQATGDGDYGVELPAGQYYLYRLDTVGVYQRSLHGAPTALSVGAGLTMVDTALDPSRGAITGTVTDSVTANPLPGVMVIVMNESGVAQYGTITNGSGQYTVTNLRPGTYYVASVDPLGARHTRFHPSAATLPGSTPVSVTGGVTSTSDGTLPPQSPGVPAAGISGRVSQANGSAVGGAWVLAVRTSDFTLARAAIADSNGNYAMSVPAGGYKVAFIDPTGLRVMEWHDDQPASGLASATSVTPPALHLDATLASPPSGAITGRILRNGFDVYPSWAVALSPDGVAAVAATGQVIGIITGYTMGGLPAGNYRVAFIDPSDGRVEYWQNQESYSDATTVPVAAGTTVTVSPDIAP